MDALEQIKGTFFQECQELLADLEAGLMALETGEGDDETINAVFRAVHSVKGGAGAFGMDDLVAFAHVFETTLDEMRGGRLAIDEPALKIMLRAADMLSDHVGAAQHGTDVDLARSAALAGELAAMTQETPAVGAAAPPEPEADEMGFTPLKVGLDSPAGGWRVRIRPAAGMYAKANDIAPLLREMERLGPCTAVLDDDGLPDLEALDAEGAYLAWTIDLTADCPRDTVAEVFEFVDGDCSLSIEPLAVEPPGLDIEALLAQARQPAPPAPEGEVQAVIDQVVPAIPVAQPDAPTDAAGPARASAAAANASPATIRVDLERVDRLIDLVGELVINQAMLAQRVGESGFARSSNVAVGLDELEQLTREIQDSVMAIRAQPVKSVFQRMPRLVREIAASTGKEVRLVTEGEGTEVDKTVIERLSDPITHMIRNAIDHGLESPAERRAAGKPAEGTVRLAALHRSGRIVIEVGDDGAGINRPRVRQIAIDKGLIDPEALLSDEEVDNLLFLPGFSTASAISNISGRGVGMDVVKRSIQALGGRITITSNPGKGSTFTMSLPLTLAVLDGMVVSVGDQTLVTPLTSIIETLQPKPADVRTLGPSSRVIAVRDAFVPLIDIGAVLGWRPETDTPCAGVCLLVENEGGGRAALLVDGIQGQRQVVIKSLEANFQQVAGIAAATILGDGRVALILDVDAVIALRGGRATAIPSLALAS
ncbi:chemotaxis protein CheA [Caulobacter sp. NIBR1757]|uniref:chemotaxis protein CheA n=1 Tax=Caulobacter sp. NIBR1757 TaxID=3016000 RepID=UPI0022F0563F|nr:chemotaxis protein CheA [Caulobacter sp. NIBR1757]WGM38332.1 Chemotaxis protein CheA [Caulobacter sp. NIBR1757]